MKGFGLSNCPTPHGTLSGCGRKGLILGLIMRDQTALNAEPTPLGAGASGTPQVTPR